MRIVGIQDEVPAVVEMGNVWRENGRELRSAPAGTPHKELAKGYEAVSEVGGKPEKMVTWKPKRNRHLKMENSQSCQFMLKVQPM